MIPFTIKHPAATQDSIGLIPSFLDAADPHPAKEQFAERYAHGGGWKNFKPREGATFKMSPDGKELCYHDGDGADEIEPLLAEGKLRDETIRIYDAAWVVIVQPDGTYEISRMD